MNIIEFAFGWLKTEASFQHSNNKLINYYSSFFINLLLTRGFITLIHTNN